MSPPDTNLDKQKKRHKAPLTGMWMVVIFAGVLLIALATWQAYTGNEPRDASDDEDLGAEVEGPAETPPATTTGD